MPRKKRTDYFPGCLMPAYDLHLAPNGSTKYLVEQRSGKRVDIVWAKRDDLGGFLVWPKGKGCAYIMEEEIVWERE